MAEGSSLDLEIFLQQKHVWGQFFTLKTKFQYWACLRAVLMSEGSSLDLNKISVFGKSVGSSLDLENFYNKSMSEGSSMHLEKIY